MSEIAAQPAITGESKKDNAFFRQSGWLMIANVGAGAFMWAVHFLSRWVGPTEYGVFVAFLSVAMVLPTFPLQMVLAQQTAKALAEGRQRELAGIIRSMWVAMFVVWLVAVVVVVFFRNELPAKWQANDPACFWLTLPILLGQLWMPLFWGALQGKQDFLWLGWSMMLNGFARIVIAGVVVVFIAKAAGLLTGVLIGITVTTGLSIWKTRDLWAGPAARFDWRGLLGQVIPLMVANGAFQFLFTADTLFGMVYINEETLGYYGSAGTLSRALIWLVGPLAVVMFPRLVHSVAKSEKSNLMNLVLAGTAVLSVLGAIAISVLGPLLVRFVSGGKFVAVASTFIPWYVFAMIPLALANVLLSNLLAKADFRVAGPLFVVAAGYALGLTQFHATPVAMLQTMGVFNSLMFAVCAWFTWISPRHSAG